jgi:hypothetical protein
LSWILQVEGTNFRLHFYWLSYKISELTELTQLSFTCTKVIFKMFNRRYLLFQWVENCIWIILRWTTTMYLYMAVYLKNLRYFVEWCSDLVLQLSWWCNGRFVEILNKTIVRCKIKTSLLEASAYSKAWIVNRQVL